MNDPSPAPSGFSLSNITGAPGLTLAAIAAVLPTAMQMVQTGGLPHGLPAWLTFGGTLLCAAGAALSRK